MRSIALRQIYRFVWEIFLVDALVFEFMGLAIVGLCIIVLVVPSTRRQPGRQQLRDF